MQSKFKIRRHIMDLLKKIFPLSWKYADSGKNLAIGIIIYIVAGILAGAVIGILAKLPIVGIIIGILGGVVDLYALVGIILEILVFANVIKD
jgi:hypothetical protein